MPSPELVARLQFVNDAAHLLMTTAPSTSRYLMSGRNSLMFDNAIEQSDSLKRNVCCGCGNIMVVGWQAALDVKSQRPQRPVGRDAKPPPRKDMVYKCKSCGRTTLINIASPARKQSLKPLAVGNTAATKQLDTMAAKSGSSPSTITPNSSSKKRAKARRQGSLAAMLANKNSTASTIGFGLDLMDFMKKV